MVIAAWKRFEKTPQWQRKKRFLNCLIGKEFRLDRTCAIIGRLRDGGYRIFAISGIDREVSLLRQ